MAPASGSIKSRARASPNAARAFEAFNERGTLNIGAPADVAVLELRNGTFEFIDNYNNKRNGTQRLFPVATVLGGKRSHHARRATVSRSGLAGGALGEPQRH